jgi:poly-beta-1,6-N-acetyl-D-glucosamine synthase
MLHTSIHILQYFLFAYGIFVFLSYILMSWKSWRILRKYQKINRNIDFNAFRQNPDLPSISVIAPAYNEGLTIVENVRSLLALGYNNLTIIVVNDGSKDDTLEKVVQAYDLEKINYYYKYRLDCNEIKAIYKSKNKAFRKLLFVDKVNGGKADALNAGINISYSDYFACVDVDCLIEENAFEHLIFPVINSLKEVVAVGGMVWLNNNSEIFYGNMVKLKVPDKFIPRIQLVEYFRAFLLGRTAWSSINGLLIISGAFGIFRRERVIEAGGYNKKTVGEDMELVIKLHKTMLEKQIPYEVAYVPTPLCWTEAPTTTEILSRQRNRWTRGTAECLMLHKNMLFRRKYGIIGLLSLPYWLFVEWFGPFIEAGGLLFTIFMAIFGYLNWAFFLSITFMVFSIALFFSILAIFAQETFFNKYVRRGEVIKLLLAAILEPFIYHPLIIFWAIKGNYDLFFKKDNSWGEMVRMGYTSTAAEK